MKRVVLCVLALLLSVMSTVAIVRYEKNNKGNEDSANVVHIAEVRRLITDKTEYAVGDPIMVTAWTPDVSDTIILMSVSDRIAIRKAYVGITFGQQAVSCGEGSGIPLDISQCSRPGGASNSAYVELPAGEYVVLLQDRDGAKAAQIYITIK